LGRRKAREIAVQVLYQLDMNRDDNAEHALQVFWEQYRHTDEVREFATRLVRGAAENREKIDTAITRTSKNWSFNRITPVDRSILREAVFEILFCPDIPYKVTLNEAIELGKKFGSEKSGAFINGVLDNVLESKPGVQTGGG